MSERSYYSETTLRGALDAVERHGSLGKAGAALGVSKTEVKRRVDEARRRNLASAGEKVDALRGLHGTEPVLPGFVIKQTSAQLDAEGQVEKQWVQQKPEPGEVFEVPLGQRVKGVSALVDPDGRTLAKWIKTKDDDNATGLVEAIRQVFEEYKGAQLCPPPEFCDEDLLTVYNVTDHHFGLHSWGRETGLDWNLEIGERVLLDAMSELVASTPRSKTAIILNLGDFFHADNQRNATEASGHQLDVDTRFAKIQKVGVKLLIQCIDMALQKHERVIVRCLPGNHDPMTAITLAISLACKYDGDPRVTIDESPDKFFKHVFGKVMIAATHGDKVKPADMPGVMASYWPKEWGATAFRYAYFGHVHHASKGGGENHGVTWETFQTLAAKDAWHHASGYSSGRSMVAITHHRERGEKYRNMVTASVEEPA